MIPVGEKWGAPLWGLQTTRPGNIGPTWIDYALNPVKPTWHYVVECHDKKSVNEQHAKQSSKQNVQIHVDKALEP